MSLMDHLPVLVVLIPLLTAPVCSVFRNTAIPRVLAQVAAWASFGVSALLLNRVMTEGTVRYQMGGWEPPWGIEYRIDLLGGLVLTIVTAIAALVLTFAPRSVAVEIPERRRSVFYAVFLLCFTGLAGMTITGDAFNLFVFLEISSLSSYALISLGRDRRALSAAFQYLIMGSIGATFILIGIGFIYMMTGTLNMDDMAQRIPAVSQTGTIRVGFAFVTVGFGLKVALFPLHLWLPNVYAYAPSVVSAFLGATATKVAVYALLRIMLGIFGVEFALGEMPLHALLLGLGALGVVSASLVAVFERNVKRMLAYSSVAQVGYMVLGIGLASQDGVTASILHIFNHALMKGALFLALGAVMYRIGSVHIRDLAGLGRRMPLTAAAILVAGLSLIGVPGTVGFVSKWYLVLGALDGGMWPLAMLVLFGSVLALVYVWRLVEAAWFTRPADDAPPVQEAPLQMLVPILLLALANLWFGIDTDLTAGLAQRAADTLLEVSRG